MEEKGLTVINDSRCTVKIYQQDKENDRSLKAATEKFLKKVIRKRVVKSW